MDWILFQEELEDSMEQLPQHEKEEFINICVEHGLNYGDKRFLVLEEFLSTTEHLTVSTL